MHETRNANAKQQVIVCAGQRYTGKEDTFLYCFWQFFVFFFLFLFPQYFDGVYLQRTPMHCHKWPMWKRKYARPKWLKCYCCHSTQNISHDEYLKSIALLWQVECLWWPSSTINTITNTIQQNEHFVITSRLWWYHDDLRPNFNGEQTLSGELKINAFFGVK